MRVFDRALPTFTPHDPAGSIHTGPAHDHLVLEGPTTPPYSRDSGQTWGDGSVWDSPWIATSYSDAICDLAGVDVAHGGQDNVGLFPAGNLKATLLDPDGRYSRLPARRDAQRDPDRAHRRRARRARRRVVLDLCGAADALGRADQRHRHHRDARGVQCPRRTGAGRHVHRRRRRRPPGDTTGGDPRGDRERHAGQRGTVRHRHGGALRSVDGTLAVGRDAGGLAVRRRLAVRRQRQRADLPRPPPGSTDGPASRRCWRSPTTSATTRSRSSSPTTSTAPTAGSGRAGRSTRPRRSITATRSTARTSSSDPTSISTRPTGSGGTTRSARSPISTSRSPSAISPRTPASTIATSSCTRR